LQALGLSTGYDDAVTRGDPAIHSFSSAYLRNGVAIALDCVSSTKDYKQGKALIHGKVPADFTKLSDGSIPLKSVNPARP
jgi:3-phenylpropionate/trans-cinnamate dioxygenase ferredoxin reductase subunit